MTTIYVIIWRVEPYDAHGPKATTWFIHCQPNGHWNPAPRALLEIRVHSSEMHWSAKCWKPVNDPLAPKERPGKPKKATF